MPQTLKIAIPMAGHGTRMRPHTWSKPKVLLPLAGKTVLDHVLDQFNSISDSYEVEYVFIVGNQWEQIKDYVNANHPDKKVHFIFQEEMKGQSHALHLAKEHLKGPMLMAFADTLIETDLSFLSKDKSDGIAWVKPVPDPRRFGVAVVDDNGIITRLIEKPKVMDNNLAVVGFYYFRSGEALVSAISEQISRNISLNNEYFLADAINIMLEQNNKFRIERVNTWLDAGIPEALLDTNKYLLNVNRSESFTSRQDDVKIVPPVKIGLNCSLKRCIIGPNVSIGNDCQIENVLLQNSIVDDATTINNKIIENSIIGRSVNIEGSAIKVNIGDNSELK